MDENASALLNIVDVTGSTNDDARALAREGAAHGTAVAARVQTAGRGRRGHTWSSPRGSLYLSVVLRPPVPMQHFMGIPAVCALGAVDFLRDLGIAGAGIKWPNDVLIGSSKVAGILVEAGAGAGGTFAVCGIGVNVEPVEAAAGESLSPSALPRTCLARELAEGAPLPPFEELAERLRSCLVARVDGWEAQVAAGRAAAGPLAPILDEYFDTCPLLGHQVNVLSPEGTLLGSGVFAGLDCWGRATVHYADGRDVDYSSEMVSLRPRY